MISSTKLIETIRRIAAAVCLSVVLSAHGHADDDPADLPFEQGSVLVICGKPVTGETLSSEEFFAGFGDWITYLQAQADAGVVSSAHYLTNLKDGVFIVFKGPDRAEAQQRADAVIAELTRVYAEIDDAPDIAICRSHEIGPVAAYPRGSN
ncbi:MAG: hypothetical protein AAGA44_01905 [Pseudomonadota bacterium]